MKNSIKKNLLRNSALAVVLTLTIASCKKNEDEVIVPTPDPTPSTVSYPLNAKDQAGISGTVSFTETSVGSSSTRVVITLTGVTSGIHPAHIHNNAAVETGSIAVPLNNVDATGKSTTIVPMYYSTLINFDGYINVHLDSLGGLATIIAQGDIGGNSFTGAQTNYTINADSASGVSGFALFKQRRNGTTLVTLSINGLAAGALYPAYINLGSVSNVGIPNPIKTLNAIMGNGITTTSLSLTNVRKLDDNTSITYSNWLLYDGFASVHDAMDVTNILAKGNIGAH